MYDRETDCCAAACICQSRVYCQVIIILQDIIIIIRACTIEETYYSKSPRDPGAVRFSRSFSRGFFFTPIWILLRRTDRLSEHAVPSRVSLRYRGIRIIVCVNNAIYVICGVGETDGCRIDETAELRVVACPTRKIIRMLSNSGVFGSLLRCPR